MSTNDTTCSHTAEAPVLPADPHAPALSARERQVAELLAYGATYGEVARMLGVSINTVRAFVRAIYGKLDVCCKAELARHAIRLGIATTP
jgi:DNA-binding NarL/FixJ family response regulator